MGEKAGGPDRKHKGSIILLKSHEIDLAIPDLQRGKSHTVSDKITYDGL